MMVVYGRLEGSPPRVTAVTQMTSMADRWYSGMQLRGRLGFDEPAHQDVLIVEFPDNRQEDAVEFLAWMHYQPKLFEVTGSLSQDRIDWKMWSVENDPKNVMRRDFTKGGAGQNYNELMGDAQGGAGAAAGVNPCGERYDSLYEGAETALNFGLPPNSNERRRASDKKEDQDAEWANFMKSIGAEDK